MSYTKTNWQSGDVISAEKLNKMEDGITSAYTTATSAEVKADSLAETIIDFNNLETVEELGENDKVLVSSGGSVKEADASLIGGGSESGENKNVLMIQLDDNGNVTNSKEEIINFINANKDATYPCYIKNCFDSFSSALINSMAVNSETDFYISSFFCHPGAATISWLTFDSEAGIILSQQDLF